MFLRNENAIRNFDANFQEGEDGTILFQPDASIVGLPIAWEEYQSVMQQFEQVHERSMIKMWVIVLLGGAYGMYGLIIENSYATFFLSAFAGLILSFCLQARDASAVVEPLTVRLRQLQESQTEEAV